MFAIRIDVPRLPITLEVAAEALVRINEWLMRRAARSGRALPRLYESGVRYRREPPGREWWETAMDVIEAGVGDCEDLSSYRAAELRLDGVPARVRIVPTRRRTYHAVVEVAGRLEDPSRILVEQERRQRT